MNHRLILICFILINVFSVVVLNAQNDKYISTGIAANVAVHWVPLVDEADNLYLLDVFPLLNSIPDAIAGPDQTVSDAADTALVILDGSASSAADG